MKETVHGRSPISLTEAAAVYSIDLFTLIGSLTRHFSPFFFDMTTTTILTPFSLPFFRGLSRWREPGGDNGKEEQQ